MRKAMRHLMVTAAMLVTMVPVLGVGAATVDAASALTITPSTDLVDGQSVHLVASGLAANSAAGIEQCVSGHALSGCDSSTFAIVSTDGAGGFTTDFGVQTVLHTPDGTFDCRVDACVIGTNTTTDVVGAAFGPISFDPAGPLLPPPVVIATPATGLVDHQTVTVSGTGFRPNRTEAALPCIAGATDLSQCSTSGTIGFGQATAAGVFTTTLTLRTIFVTNGGTTVDCRTAVHACEIRVAASFVPLDSVAAEISFDPSAPATPPPSITATPSTGLIDGQSVHVVGADFTPNQAAGLGQCADAPGIGTCSFGLTVPTDATGAFAVDLPLHTRLWAGEILDCRDVSVTCTLLATDFGSGLAGRAALSFQPDGPLLPLPSLIATPSTGLLDGDILTLTGSGFTYPFGPIPVPSLPFSAGPAFGAGPGLHAATRPFAAIPDPARPAATRLRPLADPGFTVPVFECLDTPDSFAGCSPANTFATVDGDGKLTGEAQVWATFTTFEGVDVDCRAAGTHCQLRAGLGGDPLSTGIAELSFDPNGALLPPPTLTVTPDTGLHDGSPLHVVGDGFPADALVSFHQCQAGTSGLDTCDENGFGVAQADADGHLDAMTTAKQVLQYGVTFLPDATTATSTFDCGTAPDGCRLLVADDKPPSAWPSAGLLYASAGPGPIDTTARPADGTSTVPQFTG